MVDYKIYKDQNHTFMAETIKYKTKPACMYAGEHECKYWYYAKSTTKFQKYIHSCAKLVKKLTQNIMDKMRNITQICVLCCMNEHILYMQTFIILYFNILLCFICCTCILLCFIFCTCIYEHKMS